MSTDDDLLIYAGLETEGKRTMALELPGRWKPIEEITGGKWVRFQKDGKWSLGIIGTFKETKMLIEASASASVVEIQSVRRYYAYELLEAAINIEADSLQDTKYEKPGCLAITGTHPFMGFTWTHGVMWVSTRSGHIEPLTAPYLVAFDWFLVQQVSQKFPTIGHVKIG